MGKKSKAPQPDADGYLITGIYQRFVGPAQTLSVEESKAAWEAFVNQKPIPPIVDWLHDFRNGLSEMIRPHIEESTPMDCKPGWKRRCDLGDGPRFYRIKDGIDEGTPEYEATVDTLSAIDEICVVLSNVGPDNTLAGNLRTVLDSTFKLGQLYERICVRPFEPLVATELGRRKKRGEKRK